MSGFYATISFLPPRSRINRKSRLATSVEGKSRSELSQNSKAAAGVIYATILEMYLWNEKKQETTFSSFQDSRLSSKITQGRGSKEKMLQLTSIPAFSLSAENPKNTVAKQAACPECSRARSFSPDFVSEWNSSRSKTASLPRTSLFFSVSNE